MIERTIQDIFATAVGHHRAGRFAEADALYRAILLREAEYAEAWHHLGLLALQSGQHAVAAELIARAAGLAPGSAAMQSNLGEALRGMGRMEEAIAAYWRAIGLRANFPEAYSNLGNALRVAGRPGEAIAPLRRAVELRETYAEAHQHLGSALKDAGDLEGAARAFRRAAGLLPGHAAAPNNLGVVLREMGKSDEAMEAFRQAIAIRRNFPEAWSNLGNALRNKGQFEEAAAAFREAISQNAGFAEAYYNLGQVLKDQGKIDEAIAAVRRAIELRPDFSGAHNNLGNMLGDAGRVDEAIAEYQRGIALRADDGAAHLNLGNALREKQRLSESAGALRRAAELRPEDPQVHQALGETLLLMHDVKGAEKSFRRCVELSPDSAPLWNALGQAMKFLGDFEEAERCCRRAIAISGDVQSLNGFLSMGRGVGGQAEMARLEELLRGGELSTQQRIATEFALAKLFDEQQRFDEAFEHLGAANRLFKESRAAVGERYDRETARRRVDALILKAEQMSAMLGGACGDGSEAPVFIVGMPRSGTTLVEQIAASHRDVYGAGELEEIWHLATKAEASPEGMGRQAITLASQSYLRYLRSIGGDALRITDKMPDNVFYVGLIAAMFPNARVIFCRRDPRDIGLSCFFEQFQSSQLLYSYDLADFGWQYLQTNRLMEHWLKTLPLRMLEVRYEKLVADQESESRRLIEFLGLEWDPACLKFHETKRPVMTASLWAVRQPMYTRSVGRWRQYERHLGPLLEMLGKTL